MHKKELEVKIMQNEKIEMVRIVDNSKPFKDYEEKQYLICIRSENYDYDMWEIVTGRTEAYNYIKDNVDLDIIDFKESFVLVENCTLNERKSIYAFMKYVGQFYEDDFDIDEYIKGDWSENDYRKDNGIDESLNINPNDRLNMADIMNGSVSASSLD